MANCLDKLLRQIVSDDVRVLVVDNNSTDATQDIVANLQKTHDFLDYTICRQQGLSYARNHALYNCTDPWLSFLDDDAYPRDDWLQNNLRLINGKRFDAFGGLYLPWHKDGQKSWFKDYYETNSTFMPKENEKQLTPSEPYFSGGNCTFKVKKLKAVGGFSPELGMNGKTMGYGEEVKAQRAMAIDGAILGFSRNLVIYHFVPLGKQKVSWAWKRAFTIGHDFWQIWGKSANKNNVRSYLNRKTSKCLAQTRSAFGKLRNSGDDFVWQNFFYEVSGWAGVIGLLIGALKDNIDKKYQMGRQSTNKNKLQ